MEGELVVLSALIDGATCKSWLPNKDGRSTTQRRMHVSKSWP